MCGITVVLSTKKIATSYNKSLNDFAEQAMWVGSVRGMDNTGIMFKGHKEKNVHVLKRAVDGALFSLISKVSKVLKWSEDLTFLAIHNRSATKGGLRDEASHPFVVGSVTLIHNGTISNQHELAQGYDVDSEAIAHALSACAPDGAKDVLSKIRGAFVLVWHDHRDNSFNIAKNDDRPLSCAYVKDEETMLACSEKGMLKWLAERNKIQIGEVLDPKSYLIFKWDLSNENVSDYTTIPFERPKYNYNNAWESAYSSGNYLSLSSLDLQAGDTVEFDMYDFAPHSPEGQFGALMGIPSDNKNYEVKCFNVNGNLIDRFDSFRGTISHIIGSSSAQFPTVVVRDVVGIESSKFPLVMSDERLVPGPGGVLIPFHEYKDLTKSGCCTCSGDIPSPELTRWESDQPLCLDCHAQVYGGRASNSSH